MSLYDCKTPFAVLICLSAAVGTTGPLAAQASRVIRCGSASGGQVQCQTHGKAENVRLVRDLNRDRCRQGESWGFTDSFIWTNNGCWADFEVVYRGPQGLGRNARIITCGTTSGLQVQCETHGFATAVRLRRDLSGSRCSQPSSWGYTNALVWVSKGCRAEFEVTYGAEPSPLPTPAPAPAPAPGKRVVSCASQGDKMTFCKTDGTVTAARLLRDRSGGRCGGPGTWGYAGVSIWVKLGCQGDFEVTLGGPP
jgi:hypothetical protein